MAVNLNALMKMGEEVKAEDGPGSRGWTGEGSEAERVNRAVMEELRTNDGKKRV